MNSIIVSGEITALSPLEERPTGTPRRYISLRDEPQTSGADPITWDIAVFGSWVAKTADLQVGAYLLVSGRVSRGGTTNKKTNIVLNQFQRFSEENDLETT